MTLTEWPTIIVIGVLGGAAAFLFGPVGFVLGIVLGWILNEKLG